MSCSETSTPQPEAVDGRATEEPDEGPHGGLGGEEVVSDLKGELGLEVGRLKPRPHLGSGSMISAAHSTHPNSGMRSGRRNAFTFCIGHRDGSRKVRAP